MKNLVLLGLLLAFTHCQTTNISPEKSSRSTLAGRWIWVQSTGGFAGTTNTPSSTNQTIEIEFTMDMHQRVYQNGKLVSDQAYQLVQDKSIYTGQTENMIQCGKDGLKSSYWFDKGNLILATECFDCFTSTYSPKVLGND